MKSMLKTTTAMLLLVGSVAFAASAADARDHKSGGSKDHSGGAEHSQRVDNGSKDATSGRSGTDGSQAGDTSGDGTQVGDTSGDGTEVADTSTDGTDVGDTADDSLTTLKAKHR